jgi:hypothetical protein
MRPSTRSLIIVLEKYRPKLELLFFGSVNFRADSLETTTKCEMRTSKRLPIFLSPKPNHSMSQQEISLSMSEAQWRQLMLERIIELEALARTNHVLTTQAIHYITKADPKKLDNAATEMLKDMREEVKRSVGAAILATKAESTE